MNFVFGSAILNRESVGDENNTGRERPRREIANRRPSRLPLLFLSQRLNDSGLVKNTTRTSEFDEVIREQITNLIG
jgi:hypothetical protein